MPRPLWVNHDGYRPSLGRSDPPSRTSPNAASAEGADGTDERPERFGGGARSLWDREVARAGGVGCALAP